VHRVVLKFTENIYRRVQFRISYDKQKKKYIFFFLYIKILSGRNESRQNALYLGNHPVVFSASYIFRPFWVFITNSHVITNRMYKYTPVPLTTIYVIYSGTDMQFKKHETLKVCNS
jgi:hypothetical protein